MNLDSPEFSKLINIIRDSFRVRKNQDPRYVDVGDNLTRVGAAQHQVIFGRRGSGKSCLVVHYLNKTIPKDTLGIYILADEHKRLTYPDILIRLLIEVLQAVPCRRPFIKKLFGQEPATLKCARDLRRLLDMADESDVVDDRKSTKTAEVEARLTRDDIGAARIGRTSDTSHGRTSSFKERKLDTLERHLRDYKSAIADQLQYSGMRSAYVFVDDFYLMPRARHPDLLDYLHRLFRDTEFYMKVATIRHRTQLLRNNPQTVGVELSQDVEELTLDLTLEDIETTSDHLGRMLDSLAREAGIDNILANNFNPDAFLALTLTSGGVPRDFLNIFINAVEAALGENQTRWLTPKYIYKGAGRLAYQTKLKNLRDDASHDAGGLERLLVDLLHFCLKEKKKTSFLISQEDAQAHPREHEHIQQLMDFKLIHVVEPDTSAASGRPGRYEAYTLDFSLFMEPRRRNIEIIEFWKIDEQRRRTGIREAPVYSLTRAGEVFDDIQKEHDVDAVLQEDAAVADPRSTLSGSQGSLL